MSSVSLQAISWICMQQRTSFYYRYVLSFAAHLQNSSTSEYMAFVLWWVVSSSNATITPFFSKLMLPACSFPLVLFLLHNPLHHVAVPVLVFCIEFLNL